MANRSGLTPRWRTWQGLTVLSLGIAFSGLIVTGSVSSAAATEDSKAKEAAQARIEAVHVEALGQGADAEAAPVPAAAIPLSVSSNPRCAALIDSAVAMPDWYLQECGGDEGAYTPDLAEFTSGLVPGDTVYYVCLFGGAANPALTRRLLTAPLPTMTYTNVAPLGAAPQSLFAVDFDKPATTLWAIDSNCPAACTGTAYGTINLTTGAFTPVGNITGAPAGSNFSGLKFDPTSNAVYITTLNGANTQLLTLDLVTGVATTVGAPMVNVTLIDIAISNSGQMYGHNITADTLMAIDKTTGVATTIGPTGVNANFAQGMDFDPSTGTLYAFVITLPNPPAAAMIATVNLATGAFTAVANGNQELEGAIQVPVTPPVAPDIFVDEVEPNDTTATAQALALTPIRVRANLYRAPFVAGNIDVDVYSFTAAAGDRVYIADMTSFSSGSTDTLIDLVASDGTTIIETDDDDGAFGGLASNIGGAVLPTAGTYYVRVRQFTLTALSGTVRPYDLYVRVHSGTPAAEVEPNGTPATATPLPATGWMSGVVDPAADQDWFSFTANAGDTIVAIVDADPERDTPDWNPRLGLGIWNGFFLTVDGSVAPGGTTDFAPSEAFFMTTKNTGTHFAVVDASAAAGGATFTYHVSVFVIPAKTRSCTVFTGATGPMTDLGSTDFTIPVTTAGMVGYVRAAITATHAAPGDLDVTLIGPDNNEVFLFDDLANNAVTPPQFNMKVEDEAGIPFSVIFSGMHYAPEVGGRMEYFKGMQQQGTWTLRVRDDLTGNAGTLDALSLEICEPAPRPACLLPGPQENVVFSTDFETNDAGFTHNGTADEWERGTPSFAPITSAHSGTNAFKTDLDNTYDASSNQNLVSPALDLTTVTGRITLNWWQKFQLDTASNDSYWVEVREVGLPANARRVFSWTGSVMTRSVGNPSVTIPQSAGWGLVQADISDFAGRNVEAVFHLESNATTQLAGIAIDDVLVTSCTAIVGQSLANLGITKTDGQTTYFPGQVLTYTIVASNAGPSAVTGATVTDNFPAELTGVTWTCAASAGSSCGTANGTGDISATVNLLVNGTATFTATATVSASASGPIANTATITSPGAVPDPDLANNTATDTNVLISAEPVALAVDTGGNNVYEPNETAVVAPSWRNTSATAFALTGGLANHTGPAGPTYTIPDATADYGTVAAAATASCATTGNCYSVANTTATRPVTHWDSTAVETVNVGVSKTWTLHIGASFTDVPVTNAFYRFIETILHHNVTGGCTTTTYCPNTFTTREQMAVFVLRTDDPAAPPPPACVAGSEAFADVPASSPFCRWIEELANRGVVAGCGGGNYCPSSAVSRETMAVFVLRTLEPSNTPPACVAGSETFADVPASSPFCRWIEELARRGVVAGCGNGNYCPTANVTREQMSVFLAVTFGLVLYGL